MKWVIVIFLTLATSLLMGQADSISPNSSEKKHRQYGFGAIPVLSYDSDLGIKYGAVINLFDYGKTKQSPDFDQYLYIKLTNTTKGTLNAQALLESTSLLRNTRVMFEASYLRDEKMDFFGFNGQNAVYHKALTDPESSSFVNRFYYAHERKLLRIRLDLQRNLAGNQLRLLTGFSFNQFDINAKDVEIDTSSDNPSPEIEVPTLFEQYTTWGILPEEEQSGGNINLFTLGLIYDTRNEHCFCTNGIWAESFMVISPGMMSDHAFAKLVLTYRQHKSVMNDNITFSFRASSQSKLWGDIPFYMLPTHFDGRLSQDGIGGAYNLRGAMRNRVVADGFLLGNFETKFNIWNFSLLKQEFFTSISGFYDMAYITQTHKTDLSGVPGESYSFFFNTEKQRPHHTIGAGLYIVFNKNNIITVNYGFPLNPQDGAGGLYVGSAMLF
ncbi:MAG: hypothetical protein IH598_09415 [Bacteroidales bacterium]|nr:hypothetical protein [Bacteroidales bacterium]